MELPLTVKKRKEFKDVLNINDPLLPYLSEDKIQDNERVLVFEFPGNIYFNLEYYNKMVGEGYYSSFTMDLTSYGTKIITVVL